MAWHFDVEVIRTVAFGVSIPLLALGIAVLVAALRRRKD